MNNIVFKNNIHQELFNENGFILFNGVLKNEIEAIKKLYTETLATQPKDGLYESTGANSADKNNYINVSIKSILTAFVQQYFINYSFYGGAFLVKSPVQSTELHLHQDWSFVDESKDDALFFWMPLQAVSAENGTLYLIEKSHSFFNIHRSGAYPSNKVWRYFVPKRFIKTIELTAGDLLIYSPKLFHGSYKNKTNAERVAATALITNKDASFQYIHKKDKNTAEIYSIEPESYLNDIEFLSTGKIPPGARLIKKMHYKNARITTLMLLKKIYR